jgi:single-strand DNA-binding protein
MNVYTFSGNLGNDCRTNTVGSSTVCNFNVAVKAGYGDRAQTIWISCSLWGKKAESRLPEYLNKGQGVMVTGELSTEEYDGKTQLKVNVREIDLQGKGERSSDHGRPPMQEHSTGQDTPF